MLVTLVYVSFLKENFDSQALFSILMKVVNGATRVLYMQSGDSGFQQSTLLHVLGSAF